MVVACAGATAVVVAVVVADVDLGDTDVAVVVGATVVVVAGAAVVDVAGATVVERFSPSSSSPAYYARPKEPQFTIALIGFNLFVLALASAWR